MQASPDCVSGHHNDESIITRIETVYWWLGYVNEENHNDSSITRIETG